MLKDDVASEFRKSTFCYLGTWHVYKMASTCVWRMTAADFMAPLFHHFFPNTLFPWNPRLVLSTRILSLIRLSYPTFRDELANALAKESLTDIQRVHLVNLRSLCEWFIPRVSFSFGQLLLFFCILFHLSDKFVLLFLFYFFAVPSKQLNPYFISFLVNLYLVFCCVVKHFMKS